MSLGTAPTPVVALAFANDHDPNGRYLPGLAAELRGVRQALAAGADRWRVVERTNATVDDLLGVFDAHGGAVVVLHYGGHAAGYGLLLESAAGSPALAHAGGLARFLGRQAGLRLLFLNGCSTRGQVRELLAAGVPAVIATEREIEDAVATRFAGRFYTALARGATLGAAFDEARGAVELEGGAPSAATRAIDASDDDDAPADATFPWTLHVADGAALAREWHLGIATGDPLFGLPPLPPGDLPAEPFLHLRWFGPEHAPLFFGRGAETRALYDAVTDPAAPPITLLFGQAGAGKSSLLAAGMLPRLRATHLVAYLRREASSGLAGALRKALAAPPDAPAPPDAWRALETRLGRPVVVVLDQVEEAFTRPMAIATAAAAPPAAPPNEAAPAAPPVSPPNEAAPDASADADLRALYGLAAPTPAPPAVGPPRDELDALVADLVALFRDATARPAGRLVLGFRKEWLAEVRARLLDARLPFREVFLDRLGRAGVVEAVAGPARDARLRAHFALALEDGLAEVIADDLLVDPDAAVAPTLQVLLAKLWHAARPDRAGARGFDRALYQPLKDAGILLGDFLDQQIAALGADLPEAVATGLAHDVLAFHTTPHRTARTRTRAELSATYPHAALDPLVARCVDLFLLVAPSGDEAAGGEAAGDATRLAHDTLAPLVRDRLRASDRPAQRALRLLESRAPDWSDGRVGRLLDDVDLATVEVGAAGMRARTGDEERLVAASRGAARARWADRTLAAADAADDPLAAGRLLAQLADEPEPPNGLAVASRVARRAIPRRAIDAARAPDGGPLGSVRDLAFAADGSLHALGARALVRLGGGGDGEPLVGAPRDLVRDAHSPVAFDPAGHHVAVAEHDVVRVQPLAGPGEPRLLWAEPSVGSIHEVRFDASGDLLVAAGESVCVWNVWSGELEARVACGQLAQVALSPNGRWLAVGGMRYDGRLYELTETGPIERLALGGGEDGVFGPAFDATSTRLVVMPYSGPLRLWTLEDLAAAPTEFAGTNDAICWAFDPGYRMIVAGLRDGSLRSWFYEIDGPPEILRGHDREVTSIVHSLDAPVLLTTSEDGTAKLWEPPLLVELATLRGHRGSVRRAAFDPGGTLVATVGDGDAVRVWDTGGPAEPLLLRAHQLGDGGYSSEGESGARPVHVSADGRHFAIAAPNGTVRVTSLVGEPATVVLRYRPESATSPECVAVGVGDGHATIVLDGGGDVLRAPVDADATLVAAPRTGARTGPRVLAAAAVSPDGRTVALAFLDDDEPRVYVRSLDAERPRAERVLRGHDGHARHLTFAPDGRRLAVYPWRDGSTATWSLDGPGDAPPMVHDGAVDGAVFSADGARLAAYVDAGHVGVWSVDGEGPPIATFDAFTTANRNFAFTGDARALVIGSDDTTCTVWPLDGGAPTVVATGHHGPVRSVQVSADGRRLLTTADDARVTPLVGDDGPLVLTSVREQAHSAALTADGGRAIVLDADGLARVWSLSWTDLARRVRAHVG